MPLCVDSLHKGEIKVGSIVLNRLLLHVQGLGGQVGHFLFNLNWVNGVEFLDLTLLLVKIHNDRLVVSLAETTDEVVILRHNDAVDGRDGIGHVVEELTPEPVTVRVHSVHVTMGILGGSKVTRVSESSDEDVVVAGIQVHGVHDFPLSTTREDGELFVSAGLVFEALGCHSQGTQEG
jgi:hypothetical protein